MRFLRWLRDHLVTADAVYGLILYSALLVVLVDDHDALETFFISSGTIVVFWAAHVYAGTIATHRGPDGEPQSMRSAFRHTISHVSGMLYAAVLPAIIVLLSAFGVLSIENAVDDALDLVVLLLAVLGYFSFAQRGAKIIVRILGAIGTGLFGVLIIILNVIVH
ncbi:hypothetical protein [Lacisediminihabitans changchengi]|uniref:Uncharacterized protein n=1 Tax=Lacisediminihabitans changchengi TaxID=2787634 RepID=A0A934SKE9_9MICO|nr:hypothetical protein [Lacisediminihabitans changchengi]MBK4348322.1 hypothetical protein [Lacisediminihabitans changchengi]